MNAKQMLQSTDAQLQDEPRSLDIPRRALKGWRSVRALAVELDFVTTAPTCPEKACREWLRRQGIVGVRRGRVILVDGLDVDRALRGR